MEVTEEESATVPTGEQSKHKTNRGVELKLHAEGADRDHTAVTERRQTTRRKDMGINIQEEGIKNEGYDIITLSRDNIQITYGVDLLYGLKKDRIYIRIHTYPIPLINLHKYTINTMYTIL